MKIRFLRSPRCFAPLAASCLLLSLAGFAHGQDSIILPIVVHKVADLSGTLKDLTITPTANGNYLKVKGLITLRNSGTKAAKDVTAAVYISATGTLEATAKPIITLDLANFFAGDGKVAPKTKLSIPLKYKVPSLLAAALSGQYVIVELSASDVAAGSKGTEIIYGPLPTIP
jgi:hypothetical protein